MARKTATGLCVPGRINWAFLQEVYPKGVLMILLKYSNSRQASAI